jgi:hypothetical protein
VSSLLANFSFRVTMWKSSMTVSPSTMTTGSSLSGTSQPTQQCSQGQREQYWPCLLVILSLKP